MNRRDAIAGMRVVARRFATEGAAAAPSAFDKRLRYAESAAEALNLTPDYIHLAAEIAALEPGLNERQRLALILLIVVSMAALQEGSTRFPVTGAQSREPVRRILAALCADAETVAETASAMEDLVTSGAAPAVIGRSPGEYKPLLYLEPFIYHQRIRAAEDALQEKLAALVVHEKNPLFGESELNRALSDVVKRPSKLGARDLTLSQEQRDAVKTAVRSGLTLVSGGPGTGKTSIVLAILRTLVRLGLSPQEIALAAPTGKAAYRMGESVREGLARVNGRDPNDDALTAQCPEPSTIHRLLGYSRSLARFRLHRNNPLRASFVIIDEGSMLDLTLMERLLDAVRPEARLVILGDADQLPSVAAGAVFRDLIPMAQTNGASTAAGCSRIELSHNYRVSRADAAGRAILTLARLINEGAASPFHAAGETMFERRESADQLAFSGVEYLGSASSAAPAFLDRWYASRVRGAPDIRELVNRVYTISATGFEAADRDCLRRLFAHFGSSRILCVTRVLDTGADRINALLHRRAGADADLPPDRVRFMSGEPVMALRNDYEHTLFNGDQGVVVNAREPGAAGPVPMAVFPRGAGFVAFGIDSLRGDLELCYAMTVHKAQGSEFDSIALVLPPADVPILARETLYTAVSRARKSVVVIGGEDLVRIAISRKTERYSGLADQPALAAT